MDSPARRVKESLNIAEVIGDYIELKPSGSYFKASCPFHQEKTPSFMVSPSRGSYYCFGCGASGDVFSFVQNFEGLDFRASLELLAKRAGVEIGKYDKRLDEEKDKLYKVLERATVFFEDNLKKNKEARNYLKERGLNENTIKKWRIGYVTNEWRNLYDLLKEENFAESDMEKAGLIKKKEKKSYDTFRGRIIFPIFDTSGKVIAFSGRLLGENEYAPKYLNSPDTPIFNKSETFYGLNEASSFIKKTGYSILVEGQFDLILSHQAGVGNTLATSGTAVTPKHIDKLKRFSKKTILAFDSDKAGLSAVLKTAGNALERGFEVKVVELPEESDPADVISDSSEKWKKCLVNSKSVIEFATEKALKSSDVKERIREVKSMVFPLISKVEGEMERSYFIKEIAEVLKIPEESVKMDIEKGEFVNKRDDVGKSDIEEGKILLKSGMEETFKELASMIVWQEKVDKSPIDIEDIKCQIKKVDKKLMEIIDEYRPSVKEEDVFVVEKIHSTSSPLFLLKYIDELVLIKKIRDLEENIKNISGDDLEKFQKTQEDIHSLKLKYQKNEGPYYIKQNE